MAHSSRAAFARPVLTKPIVCSAFHPVYQILIITARLPKLCFSTKIQNLSAFVNVCSVLAGFCTDTDCMQHLSNKKQRQRKTRFNSKIHSHPHLNEDISGPHKNTPTSNQSRGVLMHYITLVFFSSDHWQLCFNCGGISQSGLIRSLVRIIHSKLQPN